MIDLEPITRLTNDLKTAAHTLSSSEARFLVDSYYMMQEQRKRTDNQVRALGESGEPNTVIHWYAEQSYALEKQVARALDAYSGSNAVGRWMRDIDGIGPIIAAGLLAYIDIHKATTAGCVWRFAGLDPTQKWEKGQKRPFNAALKTLCWKIGESFVKVKGKETDIYGKIYEQRKILEEEYNNSGQYKDQAAEYIKSFPAHAQKAIYLKGMLPQGHLHSRAKRYAVKLFLAHLHEVWRRHEGLDVPAPYAIAILGHAHKIEPKP